MGKPTNANTNTNTNTTMSSFASTAFDYFHALRPHKGPPLAAGALIVGRLILADRTGSSSTTTTADSASSSSLAMILNGPTLAAAASVYLSYGAGMVMNDCVDYQADALHKSKQHRPIAAGKISVRAGWIYCAALIAVALALARPLGDAFLYWTAGNVAFMAFYIIGIQEMCLLKDILCGWLAMSPLIGASLMVVDRSGVVVGNTDKLYWLAALGMPWQTAREILGDLDDMKIDEGKKMTLPFVVGPKATHRIAYGIILGLFTAGIMPTYRAIFASSPPLYLMSWIVACPLAIRAAFLPVHEGIALVNKCIVIMMGGSVAALMMQS